MDEAIKRVNEWIALNQPQQVLVLSNLNLEQLPPIPITCQLLFCEYNKLTSLPQLPNCLELDCSDNNLSSLPQLPDCCILDCSNNHISSLPELPNCEYLYCSNNHISSLPELPNCEYLYCSNNLLTYIPQISKCVYFSCDHNQLTSLPQLKSTAYFVSCRNNKYLHITKHQAEKFTLLLKETPNYNRCAKIIQRNYKKHLRKKYNEILCQYMFKGPANIVCLFTI